MEYGLGRKPSPPDARDWSASKLLAMVERGEAVPVLWASPKVLYQDGKQHCVGYCGEGFKGCANGSAGEDSTISNEDADRLYYECKKLEGDPTGEDGACMRSIAKVLKTEGVIDAYAFGDFNSAAQWLQVHGPVMLGIDWYSGMNHPDTDGTIHVTGNVVGGHAIIWRGDLQLVGDNRFRNSWDVNWGDGGDCFISDDDLRLLVDRGEAIMAVRLVEAQPMWMDLPPMDADDVLSQFEAWKQGVMTGFTMYEFRPSIPVTQHQVGSVMVRIGMKVKNPWNGPLDWTEPATRGWVHDNLPKLRFDEARWDEPCTRFQLLLLVGRYLRGV